MSFDSQTPEPLPATEEQLLVREVAETGVPDTGDLDKLYNPANIDGYHMFLVTLTFPGTGLEQRHLQRLQTYLLQGEHESLPRFWLVTLEGGGNSGQHLHAHGVFWYASSRRSDSVTRSFRTAIYAGDDLTQIPSLRHLCVTRSVTRITGALRYVLKEHPTRYPLPVKLPPNLDLDSIKNDSQRHQQALQEARAGRDDGLPTEGTCGWPPSTVPDKLAKLARSRGLDPRDPDVFGHLVHIALAGGARFDASSGKLSSYRLILEAIFSDPDDPQSKVLHHELMYRSQR